MEMERGGGTSTYSFNEKYSIYFYGVFFKFYCNYFFFQAATCCNSVFQRRMFFWSIERSVQRFWNYNPEPIEAGRRSESDYDIRRYGKIVCLCNNDADNLFDALDIKKIIII